MRQGWLGTSPSRNCSAGCDAQIKIMQHLSVSRVPLPPACNLGSMLRGYFSVVSIKVEEGRGRHLIRRPPSDDRDQLEFGLFLTRCLQRESITSVAKLASRSSIVN